MGYQHCWRSNWLSLMGKHSATRKRKRQGERCYSEKGQNVYHSSGDLTFFSCGSRLDQCHCWFALLLRAYALQKEVLMWLARVSESLRIFLKSNLPALFISSSQCQQFFSDEIVNSLLSSSMFHSKPRQQRELHLQAQTHLKSKAFSIWKVKLALHELKACTLWTGRSI